MIGVAKVLRDADADPFAYRLNSRHFQVVIDHDLYQVGEGHAWFPAQFFLGLADIGLKKIDFCGAEIARVDLDDHLPGMQVMQRGEGEAAEK